MALPPGITTRTYSGTIVDLNGTPAEGTLTFRLPAALYDADNNVVVGPANPLTADVTAGAFSIPLPCAPWLYSVRIDTDGIKDMYVLSVPVGSTGPLHFADTYRVDGPAHLVEFFALLHHLHATGDITGLDALLADLTERVDALEDTPPGGGVTDHGALTGLGDDDHGQYYNAARLAAVLASYATTSTVNAGLATKEATGTAAATMAAHVGAADPHSQYAREADLAAVATSGAYADLTGKPTIPDDPADIGAQPAGDYATNGALTTAIGTRQPLDADLTALAALAPADNDFVQRIASAWTNRTPAQVKTSLALTKGDVGLGNVDNTSDVAKPVSTATQTALDAKLNLSLIDAAGDLLLGSADNTAARLPKGANGQLLGVATGTVGWVDAPEAAGVDPIASRYGCAAISINPQTVASFVAMPSGRHLQQRIAVPPGQLITELRVPCKASATGAGAMFFGVYQSDHTQLGASADVSASFLAAAETWVTVPLITPASADDGFIWVTLLTTMDTGAQLGLINAALADEFYWLLNGISSNSVRDEGVSVLPSTINPGAATHYLDWLVGVA